MTQTLWLFNKGDPVPADWYEARGLKSLVFGTDVEVELAGGFRHVRPLTPMDEDDVLVYGEPISDGDVECNAIPPFFFHTEPENRLPS